MRSDGRMAGIDDDRAAGERPARIDHRRPPNFEQQIAAAPRDSCRRVWLPYRAVATDVVPNGKNQLYVPYGTALPTVRLSLFPVCAVSSFKTTTAGCERSSVSSTSGQSARAVSVPTMAPTMASHSGIAGSHATYRSAAGGMR